MSRPQEARSHLAAQLGLGVAQASRRLGLGSGSVIGGRVTMAVDPGSLRHLASGRRLALVSGTNGKTTTTRLLSTALATAGPTMTNRGGSNLPAGLVAAFATSEPGVGGALEVDEAWLGQVAEAVRPAVVVLLNLSRDQLDRVGEVRRLGAGWRDLVTKLDGAQIVANSDDPLVAWAATGAGSDRVIWVAAGASWRLDSSGCPSCDARIDFEGAGWSCPSCRLARPRPAVSLEGGSVVLADGRRVPLDLRLPGRFNRANAAMAGAAAEAMGIGLEVGLAAMSEVTDIGGRFQVLDLPPSRAVRSGAGGTGAGRAGHGSTQVRLLLAKNPAGWVELLDLLDSLSPAPAPVVLAINARIADGRDPSWLWDVPFERLAGRFAVATGERCRDLAVRLRYAEVDHVTEPRPLAALAAAAAALGARPLLEVVANYTAFQDIRRALDRGR